MGRDWQCRLTHDAVPRGSKSLVILPFFEIIAPLVENPRCKFQTSECHRGSGLLEWAEGAVEVVAYVPGAEASRLTETVEFGKFDDHRLWTTVTEVKANSFQDHALNASHGSRRAIKHLQRC